MGKGGGEGGFRGGDEGQGGDGRSGVRDGFLSDWGVPGHVEGLFYAGSLVSKL